MEYSSLHPLKHEKREKSTSERSNYNGKGHVLHKSANINKLTARKN